MQTVRSLSSFATLAALVVLSCSYASGETRKLKGRIFAYLPWPHILKMASFVENQEIVILRLESTGKRPEFVKVVFTSFGQEQVPKERLEGQIVVTVRSKRSKSCDEPSPKFFCKDEPLVGLASGTSSGIETVPFEQKYKISEAFTSEPLPLISNLRCYGVEMPSK